MIIWLKIRGEIVVFILGNLGKGLAKKIIEQTNYELSSINILHDKIKQQREIN